MNVVVHGLGYVGTVTAACLAKNGFRVVGVDVKPEKVEKIEAGEAPIKEPGIDDLVADGIETRRLSATTDGRAAVEEADVSIICVGTPVDENGDVDLSSVEAVARNVGDGLADHADGYHTVVLRSTVPPETTRAVTQTIAERSGRVPGEGFGVVMNPEFIREGSAIDDFHDPPFVILGSEHDHAVSEVLDIYEAIGVTPSDVYPVEAETAEIIKYASNAFHAAKVAFANEIGRICYQYGVDGRTLMEIFCQDRKLNVSSAYLTPGLSFGGSCLHKDTRALLEFAEDGDTELLSSILPSNRNHTQRAIDRIEALDVDTVGVVGLSFKPETDDLRNSPGVYLARGLLDDGQDVRIYDHALDLDDLIGSNRAFVEKTIPELESLVVDSRSEFTEAVDLVVLCNSEPSYRNLARDVGRVFDPVGLLRDDSAELEYYGALCW